MANVHARLSTSSSTTSNSGDGESQSSGRPDSYLVSASRRPSAFDLYTSSAATASTSSAAIKDQNERRQQAGATSVEANSEHSRYLKRKEQNRLAQRRHREKQRQDVQAKRQRTSDSGGSSSLDAEDQSEAAPSAANGWMTERVGPSSGRKKRSKREAVEAAATSAAAPGFSAVPPRDAHEQRYLAQQSILQNRDLYASVRPMDETAFTTANGSATCQSQIMQRNSFTQGVYPDLSASFPPPTSGTASSPSHMSNHGFYDERSHQLARSSFATEGSGPSSALAESAPWTWPDAASCSAVSHANLRNMSGPTEQVQLPVSRLQTQHNIAPHSWQNNGNLATSQHDQHLVQRNQEHAMRQFVTLVSQSIPWMDHLLAPRWDMIKVLKQAAEQLGLMQDYLEEDESISFLHGDYRVASRNTISTMDEDDDVPLEATQAPTAMSNATSTYPSTPDQQSHTVGGDTGMTVSVLRWTGWPSNMKPSKLSGVVSHHPFLDLAFPWPHLRDKVFAAIACDFLIEKRFCDDVWPGQPVEDGAFPEPPYTVHGDDAFDPAAYEVSNRFALRYGPLIDASIFRRTNWWRRQQGKEELPRSILDLANYFEVFFAAQIRHLLQPTHHPAPMRSPVSLPWPLQLLGSGTSMLNGQTQAMPIRELP